MSLNYRASLFVGLALIGLGVLFLLQQIFHWSVWDALWPVIVIAFGYIRMFNTSSFLPA